MTLKINVENNPLDRDATLESIFKPGFVINVVPNPVDDNADGDVIVVQGGDTCALVQAWDDETEGGIGPEVWIDYEDLTEITVY